MIYQQAMILREDITTPYNIIFLTEIVIIRCCGMLSVDAMLKAGKLFYI